MKLIPKREVSRGKTHFFCRYVHTDKSLMKKLSEAGYTEHRKQLTPNQVRIIEDHLNKGE
jgi:hypothetical protein